MSNGIFTSDYVAIYDLLYAGKDYAGEAEFVLGRLSAFTSPGTRGRLLDIGCGTGRHSRYFQSRGWQVTGADLSQEMVTHAISAAQDLSVGTPDYVCADMRSFELPVRFEAATALFHVLSYMASDEDLVGALASIRRHLATGAPFLFDFWYAGAILRDGISKRERVAENENWSVVRTTEPLWRKADGVVDVVFRIDALRKKDGTRLVWQERHPMRYFEPAFLESLLRRSGFDLRECGQWMTTSPATADNLAAYVVAQAA